MDESITNESFKVPNCKCWMWWIRVCLNPQQPLIMAPNLFPEDNHPRLRLGLWSSPPVITPSHHPRGRSRGELAASSSSVLGDLASGGIRKLGWLADQPSASCGGDRPRTTAGGQGRQAA